MAFDKRGKAAVLNSRKRLPSPQPKFADMRSAMTSALIEMDTEVDISLTALISQYHSLMVGPPGTAKSLTVNSLNDWIEGSRKCTVHCCKDTVRSMTFGPVKFSALKQDRAERVLDGGAADCHFLILEEVFKAGPAVLDTFLLMMADRTYKEGLVSVKCPILSIFGTSNEWSPEGCETALAAFFDRFLFRKAVSYLRSDKSFARLVALPIAGKKANRDHTPQPKSTITLEEVRQAHTEALELCFTLQTGEAFTEIKRELVKAGVGPIGNRRWKQSVEACQSYAYLCGASEVEPEHLEILSHVLWVDPTEQPKTCSDIVQRIANPVGMIVLDVLSRAQDVLEKQTPAEAVPKLQGLQKELQAMKADPRRDRALEEVGELIAEAYNLVIGRRV